MSLKEQIPFRSAWPEATTRVVSMASRGPIARVAAKTLVAGEQLVDAMRVSRGLRAEGLEVGWLPLPKTAHTPDDIIATKDSYLAAMEELAQFAGERPADLTIDLASFGVLSHDVRPELLIASLRELGQKARNTGVTLTLTIAEPAVVEAAYVLAAELRQDFPEVGVVLPTRLRSGKDDVADQARPGNRVRLSTVRMDAALGMTSARESGNAFVDAAKELLQAGAHVGFDTDDVLLLDICASLVERYDAQGEVVAPLGTLTDRQLRMKEHGCPVRVLVPYGPAGTHYVTRTFAQRPSLPLALTKLNNPLRRRS